MFDAQVRMDRSLGRQPGTGKAADNFLEIGELLIDAPAGTNDESSRQRQLRLHPRRTRRLVRQARVVHARSRRQGQAAAKSNRTRAYAPLPRRIGAIVVENGDRRAGDALLALRLVEVLDQHAGLETQAVNQSKREVRPCRDVIGAALLAIDTGQDVIAKPVGGAEHAGREHTAAKRCAPGSDADGRGVVAREQLVVFDLLRQLAQA